MKTITNTCLTFLAVVLILAGMAHSSVAQEMNYQGRLTDSNGDPLTDGQYTLTFSLWDAPTGGFMEWGPFIADGTGVTGHAPFAEAVNGRFNVVIGPRDVSDRSLATAFNNNNLYLELKVGDNNPITPRQKLLFAPLALYAENALSSFFSNQATTAGHADTADVATTAQNFASNADLFINGSGFFGQDTGALPASSGKGIRVFFDTSAGVAQLFAYDYAAGAALPLRLQQPGGNVGIGANPTSTEKLYVSGNTRLSGSSYNNFNAALEVADSNDTMYISGSDIATDGPTLTFNEVTERPVRVFGGLNVSQQLNIFTQNGSNQGLTIGSPTTEGVSWRIFHHTDGDLTFRHSSGLQAWISDTSSTGAITSDRRMKKDIEPMSPTLGDLMNLKPTRYRYKHVDSNTPANYGFIAQDVEEVFPDIVVEKDDMKGLTMDSFIPINTAAIQELKREKDAEIESLKNRLAEMEAQMQILLEKIPQ